MKILSYYQNKFNIIKFFIAISILLIISILFLVMFRGINNIGTDKQFICGQDQVVDLDGNLYKTIQIGGLCWTAENLKYLPKVYPSSSGSETEPMYYVYDYQGNDIAMAKKTDNFKTHGVLYNWPAAMQSCPSGMRLPTDAEWHLLESEFAISNCGQDRTGVACPPSGTKLKSTTPHWDGDNTSGLSIQPSGMRFSAGSFGTLGVYSWFWSSTADNNATWIRLLISTQDTVGRLARTHDYGFSVRCVR